MSERIFSAWSNPAEGPYKVQVFAVNSGGYYLDYRSFDSAENFNDSNYRTGSLQAGQSTTVTLIHSSETVYPSNASLRLSHYFILANGRKGFSNSHVKIVGNIKTQGGSKVSLGSNVNVTIGGVSGYSLSIPASEFKTRHMGWGKWKTAQYFYRYNGSEITVSDSGSVEMQIKGADLSALNQSQYEQVRIEIGSTIADTLVNLKCHRNICAMDDHVEHDGDDHNKVETDHDVVHRGRDNRDHGESR